MLTPQQLATWWSITEDAGNSLANHLSTVWSDPEFRRATALELIHIGVADNDHKDWRYDWLGRRVRANELNADDMLAILEKVATCIDVSNLPDFMRNTFAHFAYSGEYKRAAEILDAVMSDKQGLERWTREGWEKWTAPSREVLEWQIRDDKIKAEKQQALDNTQKSYRTALCDLTTRREAARKLANTYLGWTGYPNVPKFKDLQDFYEYLGDEALASFRMECEACLADESLFSVDKILECEAGSVWLDCVMSMFALWIRLEEQNNFSDISDEARAAGWFAATMLHYGPRPDLIQMKGERKRLQSALKCSPEMLQSLRERFTVMSYDEFNTREFLRDAVIPDTGGDGLAFKTGLAWIRSAPERLSDGMSDLLTALRSVSLPEAEVDSEFVKLANDLSASANDLPEPALLTLQAIAFRHDKNHPVPAGAGEAFLSAIWRQRDYYVHNADGGHREAYAREQFAPLGPEDIALQTDTKLLPIEAKGQWNNGLYTGVIDQLVSKYSEHWKAKGRGIYLVYWLGADQSENRNKVCKPKGLKRPDSPETLKSAIEKPLSREILKRISVVVLDVTGK